MTFLPIVERELRAASRRRATYWGRFAAAILGAGLAATVILSMSDESPSDVGQMLFYTLAGLVFVYAAFVGIGVTSDCLSEEKREGTLGLLFLTDLKGYDVILGKLAASSVNAFYALLAVVPVMAIAFLMGGVTHAEFWRVVLVAVNLLFFLMSTGMFASSICRKEAKSLGLAILIAIIILGGPPLYVAWRSNTNPNADYYLQLMMSPGFGCFAAFDELYKSNAGPFFWLNFVITNFYCWIFLLLACWLAPRSWQEGIVGRKRGSWKDVWRRIIHGSPARRALRRERLLEKNPFWWRVAPDPSPSIPLWLALGGIAIVWFWICLILQVRLFDWENSIGLIFTLNVLIKIWMAKAASGQMREDRRSGAMELVLTTTLTGRDIVRGQRLALLRQFAAPAAALIIAAVLTLAHGWRQAVPVPELRRDRLLTVLMLAGFLLFDLYALAWTGMWLGLKGRKSSKPALMALLKVLGIPWGIWLLASLILAFNPHTEYTWVKSAMILSGSAVAADLWFAFTAKYKLRKHFRTVVAEGLTPARLNG